MNKQINLSGMYEGLLQIDVSGIKTSGFRRFEDYLKAQDDSFNEMRELIREYAINSFDDLGSFFKKYERQDVVKELAFYAMRIFAFEMVDAFVQTGEKNRNMIWGTIHEQIGFLGLEETIKPKSVQLDTDETDSDDFVMTQLEANKRTFEEELNNYIDQSMSGYDMDGVISQAGGDVAGTLNQQIQ